MKTKCEDMNPFYRVIDTLCAKKGISHRELAERIGIGKVTLSRYLNGERKVQLSPFMSMCEVLDINPESLFKIYTYARLEQINEHGNNAAIKVHILDEATIATN